MVCFWDTGVDGDEALLNIKYAFLRNSGFRPNFTKILYFRGGFRKNKEFECRELTYFQTLSAGLK